MNSADEFFPLPADPPVFWPEMQRLGLEVDPDEIPPPEDLGHAPLLPESPGPAA